MLLYIIRHADPDYAAGTITPAGHKEAAALAETMPRLRPTHLYSSPLGRAKDTAAYSVEKTGLPLGIEEWTREIRGYMFEREPPYDRLVIWDEHGEKLRRLFHPGPPPKNWLETPPFDAPGFADTLQAIADHSDAFLARHGFHREGAVYRLDESHPGNRHPPLCRARGYKPPASRRTRPATQRHQSKPVVNKQGAVAITRHKKTKAVMIPFEMYQQLTAGDESWLEDIRAECREMVKNMQGPEQRKLADRLFEATPEELGEAAVRAAQQQTEYNTL